jgi:hypothetical protein
MGANITVERLEDRQLLSDGVLGFAFPIGAERTDRVTVQVSDSTGNLYLAGWLGAGTSVDFNPSNRKTFKITVGFDGDRQFIAKYTAAGALAWARLSPTPNIRIEAMAIDRSTGGLLIAGENFSTAVIAPGITLTAPIDRSSYAFWGRASVKTGAITYVKQALTDAVCSITQIESDAAGHIFIAGSKGGEVYLDRNEKTYPTTAAVLARFSQKGRYDWMKLFKPRGTVFDPTVDYLDAFEQMAVTPAGQLFVSGVNKTVDPSPLGLSGTGTYLVSFDPFGNKLFGDVVKGSATINDLAVDATGMVLVAGAFTGSTDFNIDPAGKAATLVTGTQTDGYLARYDTIGRLTFVRQIGADADTGGGDVATSVAVDAAGYVYVGGFTWGTTYFNPGIGNFRFKSGNNRDAFVAKFMARGTFMTAWWLGGPASDEVAFLSTIPGVGGAVYASGDLHGLFDADPGRRVFNLKPVADPDIFVIKLV